MRKDNVFISIHAPREGGDIVPCVLEQNEFISIHAPREGGDHNGKDTARWASISIHAPREGGDHGMVRVWPEDTHFNPRPPRGGRH